MLTKGVTLRGLEVFDALATHGSIAAAAAATGLSQPAVSQQLRNLETALGTDLVDHGRRPMQLTPGGRAFLTRTRAVLQQLRLARTELTVMDLSHLSRLDMGVIDDFDTDLTPRLVSQLAGTMTRCRFRLVTAPSHEITAQMMAGQLHLAIAASPGQALDGVTEYPIVRDPFVMVCPAAAGGPDAAMRDLPFLRHDRAQLIGRQVEAQLTRHGMDLPERFEIGPHLTLMALVARGVGWTITTPLGWMRAARYHDRMTVHPPPVPAFSRTISVLAGRDWAGEVPRDVARTMRGMVADTVIAPALALLPWLDGALAVVDET